MSLKGMLTAVALSLVALSHATATTQAEQKSQGNERLFLTSTGSNQSVTISNDTIILFSLVILGLIAAVVVLGLLNSRDDATGYTSPTSYAAAPTYEESSYAVQRTLEEAAKKFL
ncbi:uncharacterized protein [Panulirus ornatus]|uniref:uncharacterized protein n=1 Tax=Panulirus ornatus TaxID=150431 RepID=UPI003A89E856